jgi:uncharacterized protein YndB with AHSA1/START domain
MIRIEIDTTINRPVEEVFEYLIDISAYSKWLLKKGTFVRSWQTSEGPAGLGTTFLDKSKMGTSPGEITEFQRPTNVAFHERLYKLGKLVMEAQFGYVLESTGSGTKVHVESEVELYGMFKLMQPMVAIMGRWERNRVINALKKYLESQN